MTIFTRKDQKFTVQSSAGDTGSDFEVSTDGAVVFTNGVRLDDTVSVSGAATFLGDVNITGDNLVVSVVSASIALVTSSAYVVVKDGSGNPFYLKAYPTIA